MKKYLIAIIFLMSFSFVSAEEVVEPIIEEEPVVEPITIGNGNPYLVVQAWGLTGLETPMIKQGSDPACSSYLDARGCYDLKGTLYYYMQMIETARQLREKGQTHLFPQFSMWF